MTPRIAQLSVATLAGLVAVGAFATEAKAAWESRSIAGMTVEVYTPASTSPIGTGRGVMIPLHGCTQTAVQLRDYGNFEHTAEEFGMVIAIPLVPNGGVVAGCWNYYGAIHTRSSGHNGNLIELAETLRDDAALAVDPAQIYLAGFSSGGGQAVVVGCLAPDLFAGVGIAAGPSLGTSVSQISSVSTTAAQAATLCNQLAGTHSGDFATQLAVAFTDTSDFTVAQGYAAVNADMFASIYGGGTALASSPFDMTGLPGTTPAGSGNEYDDADGPRIAALVSTNGSGHAWPSGSGMGGLGLSFVSGNGLDFANYLAEFFTANSRRATGDWDPGDDDGGADTGAGDDDGNTDAGDGTAPGTDDGGDSDGGGAGTDDDGGDAGDAEDDGGAASVATFGQDDGRIEPSGCQCNAGDHRGAGGLAGLGLGFLALVRRRRHGVA